MKRIDGAGRRVLVVDDDLAIRVLLDAVLKRMGFSVMLAPDGRRALELLDRYEYDLILLDLLMPVLDGYEVLARIDARKRARVVVFTGVEDGEIPGSICRAIRKPFDLEEFSSTIEDCLESRHDPSGVSDRLRAAEG